MCNEIPILHQRYLLQIKKGLKQTECLSLSSNAQTDAWINSARAYI